MPDEEIDKLVRDAASQHHPPYDDKAWGKMEAMLDKHLPQKKDRRRPVIFLLSFLLLGGAAFWGIENAWHKNNVATSANNNIATTSAENNTPVIPGKAEAATAPANTGNATESNKLKVDDPQTGSASTNANTTTHTIPGDGNGTPGTVKVKGTAQTNTPQTNSTGKYLGDGNNTEPYAVGRRKSHNSQKGRTAVKVKTPVMGEQEDNTATLKTTIEKSDVADNTVSVADAPSAKDINNDKEPATVSKTAIANDVKEVTEKTATEKNTATATSAKKKTTKSFSDKLAVTVSAGSDVSFIELSNAGKLKPAYGAGLSYAVGKHITVGSGLYVSKKVYTALPYQYKFGGYIYPNLKEIGADCKVFEIPVSVYYNFKQVKNHNWLAGISLSSLLMKKEWYDYRYQTPAGQSYNYEKTVTNENKHYFSVLTLSGGYQYKLNNRFSLIAEPYLKIPLAGIGLGKIKLNSTGILVTAAIKPFSKKRK